MRSRKPRKVAVLAVLHKSFCWSVWVDQKSSSSFKGSIREFIKQVSSLVISFITGFSQFVIRLFSNSYWVYSFISFSIYVIYIYMRITVSTWRYARFLYKDSIRYNLWIILDIFSYQLRLVFPSFGSEWCSLGSFKKLVSPNRISFLVQKVFSSCGLILTMKKSKSCKT